MKKTIILIISAMFLLVSNNSFAQVQKSGNNKKNATNNKTYQKSGKAKIIEPPIKHNITTKNANARPKTENTKTISTPKAKSNINNHSEVKKKTGNQKIQRLTPQQHKISPIKKNKRKKGLKKKTKKTKAKCGSKCGGCAKSGAKQKSQKQKK